MGREDPARAGSVSSFDLRILSTWMRNQILRVIIAITGTARNRLDDLTILVKKTDGEIYIQGVPKKIGVRGHFRPLNDQKSEKKLENRLPLKFNFIFI